MFVLISLIFFFFEHKYKIKTLTSELGSVEIGFEETPFFYILLFVIII